MFGVIQNIESEAEKVLYYFTNYLKIMLSSS